MKKYIHILYGKDVKFSKPLLELFHNNALFYGSDYHLFITPFKDVYEQLSYYDELVLDESGKNLYKKYNKSCDYIISHGSPKSIQIVLTPSRIKKKIIFRYWGGSNLTRYDYSSKNLLKNLFYRIKKHFFKKSYESFWGIGIANSTDIIDLSNIINNTKYYYLPYLSKQYVDTIEGAYNMMKKNNGKLNIMIGHRGTRENNHIEIIKWLSKLDLTNVNIYVVLSYGDESYIKTLKEFISNHYQYINIISDFMDLNTYASFLSKIDIGIFDGITSYALGTIAILLKLRKTLYLNSKGVIAKALENENTKYYSIDLLKDSSCNLHDLIEYPVNFNSDLEVPSIEKIEHAWMRLFNECED